MKLRYFLAKTDPETYSVQELAEECETIWDGVRSPQALRAIRAMNTHDRVFIYHSMKEAAIVGLGEVVAQPVPDPKDVKLWTVRLRFLKFLEPPVSLKEIKTSGLFEDWALVRQSRLSTMEAPPEFVAWVKQRFPGKPF